MIRTLVTALPVAVLAGVAGAHPHAYVDQQAQLSLGLDRAEVTVVIVPSVEDGSAIFDHVDKDGDDAVSKRGAQALAVVILAGLRLEVDGQVVRAVGFAAGHPTGPRRVRLGPGRALVLVRCLRRAAWRRETRASRRNGWAARRQEGT